MEALAYFDLSTKTATESLGGGRFEFPRLQIGDEIVMAMRFAKRVDGDAVEVSRVVQELRASIGVIDQRPESGAWTLKVGNAAASLGFNLTTSLRHDISPTDFAAALNALTEVGPGQTYGAATVEKKADTYLVVFDGEVAAVPLTVVSNTLRPVSFVRITSYTFDTTVIHELRLVQAPVVSTSQSSRVVPSPPTITEIQGGGTSGEITWNEIQKLTIPFDFRGTYQIRRGLAKSATLSPADGVDDIAEAIAPLADEDGAFIVTNPDDGVAHIEFTEEMGGIDQALLEIEVIDAPEGDLTFTLDLDTNELREMLRDQEEVELPITIVADIEDVNDDQIVYTQELYRGTVIIERDLHWTGLSTSNNQNWLLPPRPQDYVPYTTDQVITGTQHYTTTMGDGVATSFSIGHNLNTEALHFTIRENIAGGDVLINGTDYSIVIDNANNVTVTMLGSYVSPAPAAGALAVTISSSGPISAFQAHTHTIAQIVNLQTSLDNLGTRLTALEALSGNTSLPTSDSDTTGEAARWTLPTLFEVYPSRKVIEDVETLADLDTSVEALGRSKGLLAAVHDATTEALPFPLPAPAAGHVGRVFQNQTGGDVTLTGGRGIRSSTIEAGDFAASDGRLWYPVAQYGSKAGQAFTTDFATDDKLDATAHGLTNGTIVQLTTTGTLPAGLALATDYYVINRTDDDFELSLTSGGSAVDVTDDGTGVHTVTKRAETSYYPLDFERELFTLHVNEKQLRAKKVFECRFALELAVIRSNTKAQWSLVVEFGTADQASSPALTGLNLSAITWNPIPALEQRLIVTPIPVAHRMGIQVSRNNAGALTAKRFLYGALEGGVVPPTSANFAVRARLTRFDTEDGESDPSGLVAIKGLKIDGEGLSEAQSAAEGLAIIS